MEDNLLCEQGAAYKMREDSLVFMLGKVTLWNEMVFFPAEAR